MLKELTDKVKMVMAIQVPLTKTVLIGVGLVVLTAIVTRNTKIIIVKHYCTPWEV